MGRIHRLLSDRRGDGYLGTLIKLSVILSLTACFIAIAPIFSVKQSVDYMAHTLTRTIELTGEQGAVYQQELERLKAQTRLTPNISISGNFSGTRIQLREPFILTITVTQRIKIIDPLFAPALTLDVPVSKTITGRGEIYWK
jgi:hypothetical protein